MLVDDAMWVDLVRAGFERENVVCYYKADTDSDVQELAPDGGATTTNTSHHRLDAHLPHRIPDRAPGDR